jgi:hypothetical protein
VARSDRVAIGVDTARRAVDERLHRYYMVWVKLAFSQDQLIDGKKFKSSIGQWDVDCGDRRTRVLNAVVYDGQLNIIGSSANRNAAWQGAIPESVAEMVITGVCRVVVGR